MSFRHDLSALLIFIFYIYIFFFTTTVANFTSVANLKLLSYADKRWFALTGWSFSITVNSSLRWQLVEPPSTIDAAAVGVLAVAIYFNDS